MILNYMDEKSALVFYKEEEEGKLHVSWEMGNFIVWVEHIPGNYPSTTLCRGTAKAYLDAIKPVYWLIENIESTIIAKLMDKAIAEES